MHESSRACFLFCFFPACANSKPVQKSVFIQPVSLTRESFPWLTNNLFWFDVVHAAADTTCHVRPFFSCIEMQMLSRGFELPADGSLCILAFLAPCKFMTLFVIQIWPLGHPVDPFSAYLIFFFFGC